MTLMAHGPSDGDVTVPFQRYGNIYSAQAGFTATRENRWFVSSDGASVLALDSRIYQLASFLLGYDLATSIYSSHWAVGASNVQVEPASAKQPTGQDEQDNQRAHEPHMCVETGYTSPS